MSIGHIDAQDINVIIFSLPGSSSGSVGWLYTYELLRPLEQGVQGVTVEVMNLTTNCVPLLTSVDKVQAMHLIAIGLTLRCKYASGFIS